MRKYPSVVALTFLALPHVLCAQAQEPPREPSKESEELGQRLVRKAVGQDDEDVMESLLRLMGETAYKLEVEFDPGQETQALQARILDRLDKAIRLAASQTRKTGRSESPWAGEKRKRRPPSGGRRPSDVDAGRGRTPAEGEPASSSATGTGAEEASTPEGTLAETRRTWGRLPERQREEIIQGSNEAFLEKYRAWIERYYRALQEAE